MTGKGEVKRAEQIEIYLCDHCAAVHIGLYRKGEMFAEAIPDNPEELLRELSRSILEAQLRNGPPMGRKH